MDSVTCFEQLRADLEKQIALTSDLWTDLTERAELLEYKKGEHLLIAGEICHHGYFVNKGSFVHTFIGENGEESVVGFSIDQTNRFLSSAKSYYSQQPSPFEIRALENSEVLRFSKHDLEELARNYYPFAAFYHQIVSNALLNMYVFNAMRLSLSAEDFLKYLYREHPTYLQRLPDKYVARFMGVSNEWFCKIKKRILQS